MKLFEWHSADFTANQEHLPGLIEYLAGVWKSRLRYLDREDLPSEEDLLEEKIQRQRFFDFTVDKKIAARNYVGIVQYQGIRIEIYPKIFAADKEENTTRWQWNLLYWLTWCRKIRFPFTLANVAVMQTDNLLELLICIFAHHTHDVIGHQPFQDYQTVVEETAYLKGRLDFEHYTNQNLATGKWQNFQCAHQPFVYDNLFNRIIKYVAQRLYHISQNHPNKLKLEEILFLLEDVSDLRCTADDCDKVRLNALYQDHGQMLAFCKLFLDNQVINLDADLSANCCFLVPMEYVFEDFLFGFISHHWPHLRLRSQSTDFLAIREGREVFQIKNDMYIPDQLIIDTKYKIRPKGTDRKAGVSQTDIYQMVSYAVARNCSNVILLYPEVSEADNQTTTFTIASEELKKDISVHVHSLNISFDHFAAAENLLKEQIKKLRLWDI